MAQQRTIPKNIQKIVQSYITFLKQDNLPIKKVFLYGSYAKKNAHKDSDIDICVISPTFTTDLSAMQYLAKKAWHIDSRIEPVGYPPKYFIDDDPLAYEIKRTGIQVY